MVGDEENFGSIEIVSNIDFSYVLYMYFGEFFNFKLVIKFFNGENFSYWKRLVEVIFLL